MDCPFKVYLIPRKCQRKSDSYSKALYPLVISFAENIPVKVTGEKPPLERQVALFHKQTVYTACPPSPRCTVYCLVCLAESLVSPRCTIYCLVCLAESPVSPRYTALPCLPSREPCVPQMYSTALFAWQRALCPPGVQYCLVCQAKSPVSPRCTVYCLVCRAESPACVQHNRHVKYVSWVYHAII